MSQPTMSGAERGRVRPIREVPGGIWIEEESGALVNKAAHLTVIRESIATACEDYARQYLTSRGDGNFNVAQLGRLSVLFKMHFALVTPADEGPPKPMYPLGTIADTKGKVNASLVASLPLQRLADGQLQVLAREYEILCETETPRSLSHAQWVGIVNEGKESSLKTLVSQHGSSALIQVLHGMGKQYPEYEAGSSGDLTP